MKKIFAFILAFTAFHADAQVVISQVYGGGGAASGTPTRGTVIACVREQPFALVESLDTGQYRHLGGIYRLWAK